MGDQAHGTVVVIGSFDGVHRGHQAIFQAARSAADATGRRSLCLTFHPHPKAIVNPPAAPRVLTLPDEKSHLARAWGIDEVITMTFDRTLAETPAEQFAERVLADGLAARHIVIGHDFGFGKGRRGDGVFLTEWGRPRGITVTMVEAITVGGEPVSSSRIRRLVDIGRFEEALALLGHDYPVFGQVVPGEGRGRELGYPTLNITTDPEKLLPPVGIYAARAELDGRPCRGMAYIGTKPTFGPHPLGVEMHVFDFPGGTAAGPVRAWFTHWVRPDRKFDSPGELREQLVRDEAYVRGLLKQ